MLIDTHAHVNFSAFKDDADETAKRALSNDVWFINVGTQETTSQRAIDMANKYPEGVFAAVGLHPIHLSDKIFQDKVNDDEEVEFIPRKEKWDEEKYLKMAENPKVVAIGEIGLDYFHNQENIEEQKEIFQKQIDLAMKVNKPIMIHCRKANNDIIEILKDKKNQYGEKLRGVIHCFSGRLSQAKIYTEELGFYLGFNGIITFARDYDKVLREIDLKYFVVETDCPYLTPIPFRGKRNEPLYVKYVAEKIAEVKGTKLEEVEKTTTDSAKKLFGI
jgi:TatD DNase family protein